MRLLTYAGKELKLSEHNWEQLLRRFDADKANLNTLGYYCIHVSHVCADHSKKCTQCPLGIVSKRPNDCADLFTDVMGKELSQYVYLFDYVILWSSRFDSEARQAIQKVRDALLALPKVG